MQKWEYEVSYHQQKDSDGLPRFFEELGRQGYELCGIVPNYPENGSFAAISKRPKADEPGSYESTVI